MEMMNIMFVIIGIILLYYGGEWVLTSSLSFAEKFSVPRVFSAVILIGFGTSMPEFFVSFLAVIDKASSMAVGNVLGSNVANILLVMPIGLLLTPIYQKVKFVGYESTFLIISSFFPLIAFYMFGSFNFPFGLVCVIGLFIYFYLTSLRPNIDEIGGEVENMTSFKISLFFIFGLLMLVVGSYLLVQGAIGIATYLGISNAIIGVSVVAVGTSLPEISTAIASARKGHGSMIVGNVLGSNIFNILVVLGGVALYEKMPITWEDFSISMILIPIISILFVFAIYFNKLNRLFTTLCLLIYIFYIYSWL
ncbi:MAG: sodium:calcium antiporter [Alphaproteobacteria bacterium]|nr:sodium:calcium antiporter [Alphaproteobacteria bacterium]